MTRPTLASVKFHLRFPLSTQQLSWSEVASLSKALGYPEKALEEAYKTVVDQHYHDALVVNQLIRLTSSAHYKKIFNLTFNNHSSEWNEDVLIKSINLLVTKTLTFQDVYGTRIAFCLYEAEDTKGMHLSPEVILRTLRMCGRVISPKKLQHRIKHMQTSFKEKSRVQLSEFFDLVLWADKLTLEPDKVDYTNENSSLINCIWKLVDFENLTNYEDKKIQNVLDDKYLKEEWTYLKETLNKTKELQISAVKKYRETRQRHMEQNRLQYEPLKEALKQTDDLASRSYKRGISTGTRSLLTSTSGLFSLQSNSTTNMEYKSEEYRYEPQKPETPKVKRSKNVPIVLESEKQELKIKQEAVMFDLEKQEVKAAFYKQKDLEFLIPDFKKKQEIQAQLLAEKQEKERQQAERDRQLFLQKESYIKRMENRRQFKQRLSELAQNLERNALPSHAASCDAAERGVLTLDKSKSMLTHVQYETSNQGLLMQKRYDKERQLIQSVRGDRVSTEKRRLPARRQSAPYKTVRREVDKLENIEDIINKPQTDYRPIKEKIAWNRFPYAKNCQPVAHPIVIQTENPDDHVTMLTDLLNN